MKKNRAHGISAPQLGSSFRQFGVSTVGQVRQDAIALTSGNKVYVSVNVHLETSPRLVDPIGGKRRV